MKEGFYVKEKINGVSVPFPGILFLNVKNLDFAIPVEFSFRPLHGDLISQFGDNSDGL